MIKTLHNNYCNSKQGYLPLFLSDCLNLLDPVLTFDRLMGGIDLNNYSKQRQLLREWLLEVESSGIKEFKAAITAFRNNYSYILNALKYRHISNGPTEGFNNKIKVLKRISYGVRNFKYFRNRILMSMA